MPSRVGREEDSRAGADRLTQCLGISVSDRHCLCGILHLARLISYLEVGGKAGDLVKLFFVNIELGGWLTGRPCIKYC